MFKQKPCDLGLGLFLEDDLRLVDKSMPNAEKFVSRFAILGQRTELMGPGATGRSKLTQSLPEGYGLRVAIPSSFLADDSFRRRKKCRVISGTKCPEKSYESGAIGHSVVKPLRGTS